MTKHMRGGVRLGGVSKTYGQGAAAVHALRVVDLDIPAGELDRYRHRAPARTPNSAG